MVGSLSLAVCAGVQGLAERPRCGRRAGCRGGRRGGRGRAGGRDRSRRAGRPAAIATSWRSRCVAGWTRLARAAAPATRGRRGRRPPARWGPRWCADRSTSAPIAVASPAMRCRISWSVGVVFTSRSVGGAADERTDDGLTGLGSRRCSPSRCSGASRCGATASSPPSRAGSPPNCWCGSPSTPAGRCGPSGCWRICGPRPCDVRRNTLQAKVSQLRRALGRPGRADRDARPATPSPSTPSGWTPFARCGPPTPRRPARRSGDAAGAAATARAGLALFGPEVLPAAGDGGVGAAAPRAARGGPAAPGRGRAGRAAGARRRRGASSASWRRRSRRIRCGSGRGRC